MEETIRIRDKDQEGMNMDNRKRRDLGMAYISDDAVMEEQKRCRRPVSYTHLAFPFAVVPCS